MKVEPPPRDAPLLPGFGWILTVAAVAIGVQASLPWLAQKVPWRFEKKAAKEIELYPERQRCGGDEAAAAALDKAVKRIYPIYPTDDQFSIEVSVVHESQVNAFAFLGGQIFVYDGLIQKADSPEELVGVLAHEIEHVKRRHVIHGMIHRLMFFAVGRLLLPDSSVGEIATLLNAAAGLKFSRSQEEQADSGALLRLRDASVSKDGLEKFFGKGLGSPEWAELASDHPSDESRLQRIRDFPKYASKPVLSDGEWDALKHICE